MIAPKRRLTNHALHGREEWFKRIFRDQIAEAAGILEVVLSGIVLAALLMSIVPLVELMPGLLTDADSLEIRTFLERALDIVIGIEFIKMLAKHSPGSVLEVLLYAIARHMIVGHEDAVQNLVSVVAIALIFIIRKYFFVPSFGHKMPGGKISPGHRAEGRRDPRKQKRETWRNNAGPPPGTAPHGMPGAIGANGEKFVSLCDNYK